MSKNNMKAFTLVELLVVITIIVVLLALLAPAMDRAINEAEMVVCMTTQRGVTVSANAYTADFKRSYAYRGAVRDPDPKYSYVPVNQIRDPRDGGKYDDRKVMEGYWSLKQVHCPFTRQVDLTKDGAIGSTMILCDYLLFFGWRYDGEKGMFKVGDSWTIHDNSFNIMVCDDDNVGVNESLSWSTHPDNNKLNEMAWQNFGDAAAGDVQATPVDLLKQGSAAGNDYPQISVTWSRWDSRADGVQAGDWERSPLDRNFAYGDGSVRRYNKIRLVDGRPDYDAGWERAGYYRSGNQRIIVPTERASP